jgi:hypothetical protein
MIIEISNNKLKFKIIENPSPDSSVIPCPYMDIADSRNKLQIKLV